MSHNTAKIKSFSGCIALAAWLPPERERHKLFIKASPRALRIIPAFLAKLRRKMEHEEEILSLKSNVCIYLKWHKNVRKTRRS